MTSTHLPYPFLRPEFLQALEDSESACDKSGWYPIHLQLPLGPEKDLSAAHGDPFLPLYLKTHSMGEYVFDWAWANAYQQNGLDYYPKLVTSIPFTPSTGPRVRAETALTVEDCRLLVDEILAVAEETGASSWHFLFPSTEHLELFQDPRLLQRSGVQYHWHNRGYEQFDDFTATMMSRKRKMVRKERASIADQGISVTVEVGAAISADIWRLFYQLYERTYIKRNGTRGYLTEAFFIQIAATMPEQIAMAVAWLDGQAVACALYFFDSTTLYGRYWGSVDEFPYLHFELCYYSGIEFAINRGLQRYDAGAQGEHKIVRGFEPVETHSLHWIKHPQFRDAIARFLQQEHLSIEQHLRQAREMLPYRDPAPAVE